MKIIYNNILPFPGYKAINLFGILFVRKGRTLTEKNIRHESIHTIQMQETLYIFFYLWYVIEWVIKLFIYWNAHTAYRNISFEKEAYTYQSQEDYLENRKYYKWFNYLL